MDGCAPEGNTHHLVSRGHNHLGCSRISIFASVFFLHCARHQIQCLWAQSWMAAQHGLPSGMFCGIRTSVYRETSGPFVGAPRPQRSLTFPAPGARVQVKPLCWRRPLSSKLPGLLPRSCHAGSPGAARAVREGVESLSYSVPLGTSPWSGKVLLGTPRGAGGATLAAHCGLTGGRCEHLTRTRRRVASASSKDAPGV